MGTQVKVVADQALETLPSKVSLPTDVASDTYVKVENPVLVEEAVNRIKSIPYLRGAT